MNTTTLNPVSPPAPILEHPNIQPPGAATGADPFLSILDAAANRAADDPAESASTDTAGRDDDDTAIDDDDPADEPQESTASATVAPVVIPAIDQRGPHAAAAVAGNPAGKHNAAPTGERSASSPGTAKSSADGAVRVSPSVATPAATRSEHQTPTAGNDDIDVQVARQDVTSKPSTMLAAANTATAKPAPELAPDLRAERYADLRSNPANRLTTGPGGSETRLADIGAPPADATAVANTKAAASAANPQPPGQQADIGRIPAATSGETPAAQLLAAAANPGPVPSGKSPAAAGTILPGSPALGSALPAAPAVDAALPAGAVSRDGALPEAARAAAAARSQPATTARTVEQIAVQIKNGVNTGADKIHVRLQPAALGRVDIQLEVGHDQRVQAVVVVEKADTLEVLERDARHLHRMLEDAGFNTDNDSLTFRQQTSPDQQQAGGGANEPALTDIGEPIDETTQTEVRTSHHDGLLDVEV